MKDYWCTRKKGSVHMSITIAELKNRNKDSYQLIDIRGAIEISHGAVPDAVMVSAEDIETGQAACYFLCERRSQHRRSGAFERKRISGREPGRWLWRMAA